MPGEVDELVEEARRRLGWSRSFLYRHAILRWLEERSVLTERLKEAEGHA